MTQEKTLLQVYRERADDFAGALLPAIRMAARARQKLNTCTDGRVRRRLRREYLQARHTVDWIKKARNNWRQSLDRELAEANQRGAR